LTWSEILHLVSVGNGEGDSALSAILRRPFLPSRARSLRSHVQNQDGMDYNRQRSRY